MPDSLGELLDQLEGVAHGHECTAVNLLSPLVEAVRAALRLSDVDTLAQDDGEEFCAMCLYPIDQPDVEFCETCALRARLAALRDALSLALEEKK